MDDMVASAGPLARYQTDLQDPDFNHDPAQAKAVDALQAIYDQLLNKPSEHYGLFGRKERRPHISGLYLWGGVGRGKTYLMDGFFDTLPIPDKTRLHFHRFMAKVHEARKAYEHQADPLKLI